MTKAKCEKPVLAICADGRSKEFGSRRGCADFFGVYPCKVYEVLDVGDALRAADGSEWFLDDLAATELCSE